MFKQVLTASLLALSGLALAAASDQTPVTLPDGVIVKTDMPGTLMGNPHSDKPGNEKKVYICHATSAVKNNAYLMLHTGKPAGDAHLNHEHATANGHGQDKKERDLVGVNPEFATCQMSDEGSS